MGPVLLVDDEATVRSTLAAYLEDEGFEVVEAASGEQAIRIVEDGLRPAVCIMDMRLPGMDGHAAILELHALAPDLRFVIHTGSLSYALTDDLHAIDIGEDAVFRKPLRDMKILADAVRARLALGGRPHA
jgi:CheY-like chemotaxis protein